MKKLRYEAILTVKGTPTVISVNYFNNLSWLCKWLDEVNLTICDIDVFCAKSSRYIDALELLRIWRG